MVVGRGVGRGVGKVGLWVVVRRVGLVWGLVWGLVRARARGRVRLLRRTCGGCDALLYGEGLLKVADASADRDRKHHLLRR